MERLVTKAMLDKFYQDLSEAIDADVFVIGAGPSGLVCARELSKNGGGFWIGGYYMNTITIREPANKLFDENGPIACSKLIYETAKRLGPLNIEVSEENVIKYTSEVYPGLVVCGMAVAETYGSMLLSGKKASEIILKQLKN